MRPTRRAVFFVASAIPVALLVTAIDAGSWPLAGAYLAGALVSLAIDAFLSLPPRRLGVAYRLPPLLYIGSGDPIEVTLTPARGGRPVAVELVCDTGPLLRRPARLRRTLPADVASELALPLVPLRRGLARVERLWLRWQGPLGLIWRRRIVEVEADIPVLANVRAVRAAALRFFSRHAPAGQKTQNQLGGGSDFDALREWVPGLDGRSVDWKHSARHMKLVCKEFKAERNHNIILAFDTGHLMSEPLDGVPRIDRAINASLLLAYAGLREGDRVGLFGFDSQVRLYREPAGGMQQFTRIQRAAAELDYRPEETNFTLALSHLTGRLRRRSLIVLMTDFVDTVTAEMMLENVARLTRRHLVMFVSFQDPALKRMLEVRPASIEAMARATVAHDFSRERSVVMERLTRLGVHCLDTAHQAVDAAMINRYLLIKSREMI
ncbi:MAG: DUF58 domain-containing protein [Alphaproteobacteria bacterium]